MSATATAPVNLMGWTRAVHIEEVWGTVVTFEVRDEVIEPGVEDAIAEAVEFLHQVDRWFSTYKIETPISALRMGYATIEQLPAVIGEVLDRCAYIRDLTEGRFNPWAVKGGVDPSGYVKGWAADIAADMIVARGFMNVAVNAAGDVTCRGYQSPDQPWVVGVRHPVDPMAVVTSTEVFNGAIATSGEYERGQHILNPLTGRNEVALSSATVVGPDGGLADALATALLIEGPAGVRWFSGMPGWSGYLIEGETAHFFGDAFTAREGTENTVDRGIAVNVSDKEL
jgi:thiamine biosynthesis lipoprotein